MNDPRTAPNAATANHELQPSDLGFGPLFWAARDAVIVCDVGENRVLFCNPAVEETYGYKPEELEGQPFDIFVPDYAKQWIREESAVYLENNRRNEPVTRLPMELPAVHKSGRDLIVEFTVSPLSIAGAAYVFVIVRDITERKRLEAERNALLADVQETLRKANELATLRSDFIAMIAHEVGSPIAAISGMVELLERDGLPEDKRAQISCTIRTEIQLLQRLVEDAQSALSIDRGEFGVHLQPTSIARLLQDATTAARAHLADHELDLQSVPEDIMVMADAGRINQVLRNLLGNAAKHTPAGTPVTLRARRENGRVHIDVIDQGPGIRAEDLEHIFTKFGRGRDATGKRRPGMGLGLYLSRRIVQEHGSTLFATSELGNGTTFSFDLTEA